MKIQGVEVKDATKKIVLTITKQDVRSGAKKDSNSCAAAKALCRQEQCEAAKVHFSRAYVKKSGKWIRFFVPPALRNEVLAFDRGGEFAPGEYVLTPVQPTVRLGANKTPRDPARNLKSNPRRGTRGKRKRAYHVVSGVRARMVDEWWKDGA
jgi:hypothetical protein